MRFTRQVLALYVRIWRTYFSWARTLLPLAVIVFVPLGLVHAIPTHAEFGSLDLRGSLHLAAILIAVLALTATGLVGEVFYTGAVAAALTHRREDAAPKLSEVAREIKYGRLIVVDLIYALAVAAGLTLLFVPGVLIYVYLGMAAPIIEIEQRRVGDAFRRSFRLVRGHFWLVAAVLIPIELAGDALTGAAAALCHALFDGSLVTEWLTDTVSNILLTPFYAVAAVLLTLDLVADHDGTAPRLHKEPPTP